MDVPHFFCYQSWKLDADGRLVRVVRMRPSHPLGPVNVKRMVAAKLLAKTFVKAKPTRLLRARPTVIDPARYGVRRLPIPEGPIARSVEHAQDPWKLDEWALEGIESLNRTLAPTAAITKEADHTNEPIVTSRPEITVPKSPLPVPSSITEAPAPETNPAIPSPSHTRTTAQLPPLNPQDAVSSEFAEEAARSLALAKSLLKQGFTFDLDDVEGIDDKDRSFAVRGISVSSSSSEDEREGENAGVSQTTADDDGDDEDGLDVEMDPPPKASATEVVQPNRAPEEGSDEESDSASEASSMDVDEPRIAKTTLDDQPQSTARSLKAMFAPREEEGKCGTAFPMPERSPQVPSVDVELTNSVLFIQPAFLSSATLLPVAWI